ncbi:MKI67 FHA domain-interacting nucleolar phosphoprotein-like [Copidosoma floridanum]|uniref:MKI67 FHA domain-interacting nucleolar phosphoprotein-like n=1 Tax=Copidosoma floridanum TaxID=29053 RepID=UPI0006C9AD74|nr:MKI67 FHA domain-interacting nucleolar phosphoprotein-like [Copidosoma floridanum]
MKVKKTKAPGISVLSKAVSNVTNIVKNKNNKVTKIKTTEEVPKKALKVAKTIISNNSKKSKRNDAGKSPQKKEKPFQSTRGVVYIGHIPHGFFENEMKEYFEQFGTVTHVRVARSRKTGKSRGYGYVEFKEPEVAKIAAETMNNYLMCGRLLKTTYIPPEKQHRGFFLGQPWTTKINPKVKNRMKELKKNDLPLDEAKHVKKAKKSLQKLAALEETLKSAGVNLKFKPKNVPKIV